MSTAPPGGKAESSRDGRRAGQTARVPSFKQGFKLPNSSKKKTNKKEPSLFPQGLEISIVSSV